MPVSTQVKQEEQKLAIPQEDYEMFSRENFDQKQLRYEFASVQDISLDQEDIKTEDETVIDPTTLEMPTGPAGAFDDFSTGGDMEEVVVDGREWTTHVYNHGFTWHPDMDSVDSVDRQRQHVMEMFQYFGDINFMLGIDENNDGSAETLGMVDWLRQNVSSERTFDCSNYDGDSGFPDYTGVPEDLIRGEAMKAVVEDLGGTVLDMNEGWDTMVGSATAINEFMGFSVGETQFEQRGPTFMQRLEDADTVNDSFILPYKMQPDYLPRSARDDLPDMMSFDLVDTSTAVNPSGTPIIGYDEVFLIPDMDTFAEEFVDLREMGSPAHYGPVERMSGKRAHGYKWRYGHEWDPFGEYPDATDVIHLQNVSALFGSGN